MWRKGKKSLSSWVIFVCLTAAHYSMVRWSHPIQWSIHLLYIHQSTLHRYLFILWGPGWLECLHSSEWGKRKVSFLCTVYYIYSPTSRFPLGGVAIGTSEALHRLAFFERTDEKCFVCRSLNMYGWSEAFAAEVTLTTGNAAKAGRAVAQFYFWE